VGDKPISFPFDPGMGFLGIRGDDIYRKCFFVFTNMQNDLPQHSFQHSLETQWKDKLDSGLRIFYINEISNFAQKVMDQLFGHLGVLPATSTVRSTTNLPAVPIGG
jgi:hypothetical protein